MHGPVPASLLYLYRHLPSTDQILAHCLKLRPIACLLKPPRNPNAASIGVTPGVHQRLAHYTQKLHLRLLRQQREQALDGKVYLALRRALAVKLYEPLEQLNERLLSVCPQMQVVDRTVQPLPRPHKRASRPLQPAAQFRFCGCRLDELNLRQRVGQVLQGLVVQVASQPAALRFPDLVQLLLRLLALGHIPSVSYYPLYGRIFQKVVADPFHVAPGAIGVTEPDLYKPAGSGSLRYLAEYAPHSLEVIGVNIIKSVLT